jgi:SAM-dependent methyltransferase
MNAFDEMTPEMRALKTRLKATWESGDYGLFAKYLEKGAIEFLDRLELKPGTRLLDIACGAGQLTVPAARRGIAVTGLDLAANLVAQARARVAEEGLTARIEEGDAENLPFAAESFDVVLSLIGSMFAPRPELVASEMLRVCRPGGKIVMGNWTPQGFVGQLFKVIAKHVPPPPFIPTPLLWGDEETCRRRLGNRVKDLVITRRQYPFQYPFGPEKVVDLFNDYYGPTHRAYASLDPAGKQAFHHDLCALWSDNNTASDGTVRLQGEYIEVVGIKA